MIVKASQRYVSHANLNPLKQYLYEMKNILKKKFMPNPHHGDEGRDAK